VHDVFVSGGSLERGVRRVLRDVAIGSLLIQTDPKSSEPMLLHSMLPNCIKFRERAEKSWVFLLDAQVRLPSLEWDHLIFLPF
jgi:uridine kinase